MGAGEGADLHCGIKFGASPTSMALGDDDSIFVEAGVGCSFYWAPSRGSFPESPFSSGKRCTTEGANARVARGKSKSPCPKEQGRDLYIPVGHATVWASTLLHTDGTMLCRATSKRKSPLMIFRKEVELIKAVKTFKPKRKRLLCYDYCSFWCRQNGSPNRAHLFLLFPHHSFHFFLDALLRQD